VIVRVILTRVAPQRRLRADRHEPGFNIRIALPGTNKPVCLNGPAAEDPQRRSATPKSRMMKAGGREPSHAPPRCANLGLLRSVSRCGAGTLTVPISKAFPIDQ
jgi:hypothetical protein